MNERWILKGEEKNRRGRRVLEEDEDDWEDGKRRMKID